MRVAVGPPVCIQEYVKGSLSGSLLSMPFSVTTEASFIVWSPPAFAVGGAPPASLSTTVKAAFEFPATLVAEIVTA